MGSLFHLLSREEAFELRLLKHMGYDVVALGNHEFDLKPAGLARILTAAEKYQGLPTIVCSNLIFNPDKKTDDTLQQVFEHGLIKPYTYYRTGWFTYRYYSVFQDWTRPR